MIDKDLFPIIVGRAIRRERKRQGYKFTIFCYENDVPTTTLYMLEKGNSNTRVANVYHVAELLGLSFKEFGELVDKELEIYKSESKL